MGVRELDPERHKPITILFLASDLGTTPSSTQMCRLASAFPRDRFNVEIVVVGSHDDSFADSLRAGGVAVHRSPIRHLFDVSGVRKLRQLVATLQPALIHAWGALAARASRFLVKSNSDRGNAPPLVISAASHSAGGVSGWLGGRALRRADRVVPVSRTEGDRYHRRGVLSERLTHIAPCVTAPEVLPDGMHFRRQFGLPPDSRLVMTVGRLESGIAMKSAIWGFDILRYEAPDWHLVIVGDGPDRAALEEFGRALAFDDFRVHFIGPCCDWPELLALAEVVWVTQEHDGGQLALEAMAAGKPVVAWRGAELAEIVEDGATGFLAEPGERAQLAAKTYPLIHESGLAAKLGAAGEARAREHYSVSRALEHFSRLYEELVASAR